jgi:hypothetical protein
LKNTGQKVVLAEPFPWTVTQGVIPVLVSVNNKLPNPDMDFIHACQPVRAMVGAIPTLIDIRIGIILEGI